MEFVGVGNALMDLISFVDEAFAPSLGFHNNAVIHLEREKLNLILPLLTDCATSAGGGAANAAKAMAFLGRKSAFAGCVGIDSLGSSYAADLAACGVEPLLSTSSGETGVYCALIRPDGGRTLIVSPGAALDLILSPPSDSLFRPGGLLFIEGFILHARSFFVDCVRRAKAAGMEVALDLGSQAVTQANRDFLLEFLPGNCDILFANEDEFAALLDLPLREGLELFGDSGIELVVKRAERGALWARGDEVIDSPVRELCPVDETGAGDAFAAGFLAARDGGLPPERCLRLGNRIAEEVIGVPGLGVDPDRLRRVAGILVQNDDGE
jgi:sugar/nucleoside kinase (ribokinase family)